MVVQRAAIPLISLKMIGVFKTVIKADTVDAYRRQISQRIVRKKYILNVPILRRTRVELNAVCVHMDSVMKKKSL